MIGVELNVNSAIRTTANMSKAIRKNLGDAVEKIGRKIERDSKQLAPIISGNLRRQIDFKRDGMTGEVRAKANYSHFVHGSPYHSGVGRRTTPFFTQARDNNKRYAERELNNATKKAVANK